MAILGLVCLCMFAAPTIADVIEDTADTSDPQNADRPQFQPCDPEEAECPWNPLDRRQPGELRQG